MLRQVVLGLAVAVAASACGARQPGQQTTLRAVADQANVDFGIDDNETYQIGAEMGKKPVTAEVLASASDVFKRAAMATAHTGSATAFYLGYFNGFHVMASNHHVYPGPNSCLRRGLRFVHLGDRRFTCSTFFGSWPEIDLSLFAIEVESEDDAKALASVAGNFDFKGDIKQLTNLLTVGFGIANNPRRQMMYNQDSDCKVFSKDNDFRLLADPDELNPGPYKAWSMAVGCDVSHGDSGSAMVDRATGKVVGIIWTGKIPKNPRVREAGYTDRILAENSNDIWSELSLAVPAPKIGEYLATVAAKNDTPVQTAETIKALLK